MPSPFAHGFADIRAVLGLLPALDPVAAQNAQAYAVKKGLSPFPAELLSWLSAAQGCFPPRLLRPRLILFASDHGVARAPSSTRKSVESILNGESSLGLVAEENDADLRLYDMNLDTPTADSTTGSAMTESEAVGAIVYGMMAVEEGLDVVLLGGLGQGSEFSAGLLAALLGYDDLAAALLVDNERRGTALNLHSAVTDPLEILRCAGGREMAAMLGVMIAARMARTPVVFEGVGALMAAAIFQRAAASFSPMFFVSNGAPKEATRLAATLGMLQAETDAKTEVGIPCASMLPLLRAAANVERVAG